MLDWVRNTLESLGYFGIAGLMFLENVFPPIPSELVMPLSGYTAARGDLSLLGVVIAGTVGSLAGALPWYYAGKVLGAKRIREWADRHGQWLTLSGEDVDKASGWFRKHGSKAVLFGRLVPAVRTLISVPAGIDEMPLWKFLLYSGLGTVVWTGLLAYLGYQLGERYQLVDRYLGPITYLILGGIAVGMATAIVRRRKASNAPSERESAGAAKKTEKA